MKSKNKNNNDWTPEKYEETLDNYPNLQKMIEEPFLLQLILTVLPSLVKQYGVGSRISKVQVYEVFNDQWIDIHRFDMFHQENQIAIEPKSQNENNDHEIWSQLDPTIEMEIKHMDEKLELERNETKTHVSKTQDVWEKYFNGNSIAKYVLRKVGDNKYQFVHKSCQEYYAAQKIIFEIFS
ncbi:hypothetical protein RFI_35984 [Reticulomyxa filosa]|uniref:Uncharacterized protein n=1 Tax=Reticulomyxa filosa TaxID=46433 RepID=X6LJD4_RETFI|nr:hypothetical protein RFI_35984 [Reticulomyxa filosa]|eukprot:ETO01456.1 hypothetical protein RFI_35984 [Reticulomyxa filosa]